MEFNVFIGEYEGFIKTRARALARDRTEADDLFQKAAIIMWQQSVRLSEMKPAEIRAFLSRTIKNALIDIRRKEKRITSYDFEMPAPRFESEVLNKMVIMSVIHKLSSVEQDIIFMAYQMGMDSKEIGKQLNLPPGTVRSHKARAQQKLKKALTEKEKIK